MSGGTKHDQGKPDLSLISLELLEEVARVREFGSKKYARDNWKLGFKVTRSLSAALRHIYAFLSGQTLDPESGLSHLAHAVCCLEHAIYDMRHRPSNDDRALPAHTIAADTKYTLPERKDLDVVDLTPKDHRRMIDQAEHDRRERWIAK